MPTSTIVQQLAQAVDGLLYPSETDAPWTPFHWPSATGDPTPEAVRKLAGQPATAPLVAQTLEKLFAPLLELKEWYEAEELANVARWQKMIERVKALLQKLIVVRIGEVEVAVYIIGIAAEGGWAGVETLSVET